MVKTLNSSKNQKKSSKTNEKPIHNLKQKTNVKKVLNKSKEDKGIENKKKTSASATKVGDKSLSKKAIASATTNGDKLPLKKAITEKSLEKPKTLEQKSNTPVLKKATTRSGLKKEEPPQESYTSVEKHIKTPISLEALKYVQHFLESSLSEECANFLYSLKLDFIYEDSCLKADYLSGLACKFLYILQSKGIAEYIKRERVEEKARFDFLWIIKSEEILRQARMFYKKQLQKIDEILDMMTSQEVYFDSVTGKYYSFDEAVEQNFMNESGAELKICDSNKLLKEKHDLEKIIDSITDVQLTSLNLDQ